jgi:hypothetical protein
VENRRFEGLDEKFQFFLSFLSTSGKAQFLKFFMRMGRSDKGFLLLEILRSLIILPYFYDLLVFLQSSLVFITYLPIEK